ncbi:MAG: DUF3108 domain-containing protein [Pyrinomonadaceae bacterium]
MRRTRLTKTLALAFLSLSLAASFNVPRPTRAQETMPAARLRVGEKLTYSVSFSNFPTAAHLELYVAGRGTYFGRDGIELRARVETTGMVRAALLALDDYYFTYVDPQTGVAYRAQTFTGTPPTPTVPDVLDPDARTDDITNVASPASAEAAPSAGDFLSSLYMMRAQPLAPGASYPFTTQFAGVQYVGELRVTGHETVNTPAGSFNALVAQVHVRNNKAADDYHIDIYFSDDERHVPVLITARHHAGEIRAALASDDTVVPIATNKIAGQTPGVQPAPSVVGVPVPANPNAPRPAATPARTPPPAAGGVTSGAVGDLPFNVGEQLNFNFYLGNTAQPAGTATFTVRSRGRYFNREGLLITATMATSDALSQLFPVHDNVTTYVNATTLLPFRNELQIQEGTHRERGVVTIDQERGTAIETDGKTIEIPVGTYDFVSVLYALRSFDLTPPKRNAVSLLINKRPRTLSITSVSRDTIELGGQKLSAYQLALATDDAQGSRLQLRLWVGTDRRRLPLRLAAVTPLGVVRADLSIIPLTRQ